MYTQSNALKPVWGSLRIKLCYVCGFLTRVNTSTLLVFVVTSEQLLQITVAIVQLAILSIRPGQEAWMISDQSRTWHCSQQDVAAVQQHHFPPAWLQVQDNFSRVFIIMHHNLKLTAQQESKVDWCWSAWRNCVERFAVLPNEIREIHVSCWECTATTLGCGFCHTHIRGSCLLSRHKCSQNYCSILWSWFLESVKVLTHSLASLSLSIDCLYSDAKDEVHPFFLTRQNQWPHNLWDHGTGEGMHISHMLLNCGKHIVLHHTNGNIQVVPCTARMMVLISRIEDARHICSHINLNVSILCCVEVAGHTIRHISNQGRLTSWNFELEKSIVFLQTKAGKFSRLFLCCMLVVLTLSLWSSPARTFWKLKSQFESLCRTQIMTVLVSQFYILPACIHVYMYIAGQPCMPQTQTCHQRYHMVVIITKHLVAWSACFYGVDLWRNICCNNTFPVQCQFIWSFFFGKLLKFVHICFIVDFAWISACVLVSKWCCVCYEAAICEHN